MRSELVSNGTTFGIAMGIGRRDTLQDVGTVARRAESLGFHSLWIQDNPMTTRDAYLGLAAAALETSRIRLGPGVSNPVIRHPIVIANAIATLSQATGGRAFVGLGAGGPALLEPLGFAGKRAASFRGEVAQVRALLRGQEAHSAVGSTYKIRAPDVEPPILIAADGPLMLRAAGELGDGVLISGPALPESLGRRMKRALDGLQESGRPRDGFQVCFLVNLAVDEKGQTGADAVKMFTVAWIHAGEIEAGVNVPESFGPVLDAVKAAHDSGSHLTSSGPELELIPDELSKLVNVAGSQEECRDRLREILALEPDQIVFTLLPSRRLERLETIAQVCDVLVSQEARS